MDEVPVDLRNTRARLVRLAVAAVIGGALTSFALYAMMSSDGGHSHAPVGTTMMPALAVAIFVITTAFAHRLLAKKR